VRSYIDGTGRFTREPSPRWSYRRNSHGSRYGEFQFDHRLSKIVHLDRPFMLYLAVGDVDPDDGRVMQFRANFEHSPSRVDLHVDWDVDRRTQDERLRDNVLAWLMRLDLQDG
jgi:hypothetical protein